MLPVGPTDYIAALAATLRSIDRTMESNEWKGCGSGRGLIFDVPSWYLSGGTGKDHSK